MNKKIILRIAISLFLILCIGFLSYNIVLFFSWMATTEVKMVGKTHIDFFVEKGEIIDYKAFMTLNDDTKELEQISPDIRNQISNYMKENNLKLKEGHHYFNRVDGTYEEYIFDNFKFEKIE